VAGLVVRAGLRQACLQDPVALSHRTQHRLLVLGEVSSHLGGKVWVWMALSVLRCQDSGPSSHKGVRVRVHVHVHDHRHTCTNFGVSVS